VKKRIGLGTWSWGNKLFWNYQSTNDDDLRETFTEAIRRGFDLIDTADSYGTGNLQGRSELLIGKFLLNTPSAKKKRIQIATKLAPYPWRIGNRGFNKPFLKSLERLNNKLDIVQLHWSTAKYNPWQELGLLKNLCDLKDQGFDFQIGLSNIGPQRLEKLINFINSIFFIILIVGLTSALILSPPDYLQGDSVRIMYVHVPSAWIGLASFSSIAILSIAHFIFKIKNIKLITKSIAPIGFMFTCLALVTGSIWGQPTWGTWWVWDARITSMLILALFYIGFIFNICYFFKGSYFYLKIH